MSSERTPLLIGKRADEAGLEAGKPGSPNYSQEPNIKGAAGCIIGQLAQKAPFQRLARAGTEPRDVVNQSYYDSALKSCGTEAINRSFQAFRTHAKPLSLEASPTAFAAIEQDALVLAALVWLLLDPLPVEHVRPTASVTEVLKASTLASNAREVLAMTVILILDAAASIIPISDEVETDGKDAIVHMLFKPLSLGEDQVRASVIDLILQLTRLDRTSTIKAIFVHPVLISALESRWTHKSEESITPRSLYCIHSVSYFVHSCLTIALALTPESAHYYHFNAFQPRRSATVNPVLSVLWYFWVVTTMGFAVEVIRCLTRGPMPLRPLRRLQLPPGSLIPLLAHSLVAISLLLRITSNGKFIIIAISYPLLAWAMPFFLLSLFVFPIGLPSLNPFGSQYASNRFRSLRVVNDRSAAFQPLIPFLLISIFILFWAVNGDVESWDPHSVWYQFSLTSIVAPIEARTSLAASIIAIFFLGWLMGDANFDTLNRELDIEVAARLERTRMVRYFSTQDGDYDIPLPPVEKLVYYLVGRIPCAILRQGNNKMKDAATTWERNLLKWKKKTVVWRDAPWLAKRWP